MSEGDYGRDLPGQAALQRWQAQALQRYLKQTVLPFSKHYGAMGLDPDRIRSLDDIRRIPFTTKRDLLERPLDFVLVPDQRVLAWRPVTILRVLLRGQAAVEREFEREFRPLMVTFTAGRSAEPVPFIYTERDVRNLRVAGARAMTIAGARRDMRMINMFPFSPHLAFWQAHYSGTEFGVFMVSTGGGKVLGTDGQLRLIAKLQPDVLIGMPTFLYHVLHEAAARGLRCPKLTALVLGGEKAPPGMRRKLRSLAAELGAARVDVLGIFGFTEAKMAWPECPHPEGNEPAGFHVSPDLGIVEIVDPRTGEPVGEGQPGELVFTPLEARGTVVLRYRTGDIAAGGLRYEPCPHCGRRMPRLVGPISRTSEVREMRLDKLKGTLIDFNELEHVLDGVESIGTWQLELRKVHDDPLELDELVLHVQRREGRDEERVRAELNERFSAATEAHPNRILFHSQEEMRQLQGVGAQLKEQRVVDHRPKASAPSAIPARLG